MTTTTATLEPATETITTIETSPAVETITAETLKAARANYDRLTNCSYAHSMPENWRGIYFTDTGKSRLAHTIGLLQGIALCNQDAANTLADGLCRYLDYLNGYAGMMDSPENNLDHTGKPLQFRAYRVVLSDDGGIGSFSIMWYRAVPHKQMIGLAEELADTIAQERHQKRNIDLSSEEARPVWEEALQQSKDRLKLRKELEDYRCYRPDWDTDKTFGFMYEWMSYGFCFNGGLIFHYHRDDITKGSWSTHT